MAIYCPRTYYRILYYIICMVIYVFIVFCVSLTIGNQPLQHKNHSLQYENSFDIQHDRNISFTNYSLQYQNSFDIQHDRNISFTNHSLQHENSFDIQYERNISFTNRSLQYENSFDIQSERNISFTNHSLASSLTYQIEITESYPHLPIQIYTRNRERFFQLKNPSKKIILLANTFFDEPIWEMNSLKSKTNSGNMSELYCSFLSNYCEVTTDITRFQEANAVVYHLRDYVNRSDPLMKYRHASQRFVFTLWESPINTPDLRLFNQFFNWSMTYRFDSHVFASYYFDTAYRLKANDWFKRALSNYQENEEITVLHENLDLTKKQGTAAALISNCGSASSKRWLLIRELQKHVDVTVYGKCGHACPNETRNCREYLAEHYYFLVSFENSDCQDYITEKLFTTLTLPIVPVVFGLMDYTRYLPRSAFIDVRHYPSILDLANRLNQIKTNLTIYREYFQWKKDFRWGGFSHKMTPLCDLCLRLHLDVTPNIIENIHQWWSENTCRS